jgi:hypothetical protein
MVMIVSLSCMGLISHTKDVARRTIVLLRHGRWRADEVCFLFSPLSVGSVFH